MCVCVCVCMYIVLDLETSRKDLCKPSPYSLLVLLVKYQK